MRAQIGSKIITVIALFLLLRMLSGAWKLYSAGGRLQEAKAELLHVEKENAELKIRLEEVKTPEFMEREAREKLGYGKEGEVVVVVPEEEIKKLQKEAEVESSEPNWRLWWNLYF